MPPEQRAAQIERALQRLALSQGLIALKLRTIAAIVGVAPALVAHYRPSMDAAIADTFAAIAGAEVDEVAAELAALPTPTDRVRALLSTLVQGGRDDVSALWVEAWTLGRRNELLAARVREQMDAWQTVVERVIADGVAVGEFTTDDPSGAAWLLIGMIDGLNAQALVRWGDAVDRGAVLPRAVEGLLGLPSGALDAASVDRLR